MALLNILRRKNEAKPQEERQVSLSSLGFGTVSSFSSLRAMKLSAVYCAVNQISNACAILPINIIEVKDGKKRVVKHNLYDILNLCPNPDLTHFSMIKMMIESVLLKGNAYALIVRDDALNVKELIYLDADYVTPTRGADGRIKYIVAGMKIAVDSVNMIHLFQHIDENYNGISTIKYACTSLEGIWAADSNASNFFKAGSNLSGVIESTAPINNEQKKQIKDSWSSFAQEGVHVAVLPQGLSYKPISVNPEDATLLESREYGNLEIARWFCIPPSKLWVLDNESYNSMEMAELLYLSDTILPLVSMMSAEFNRKLFKPSQIGRLQVSFDFDALLQTDKTSQAQFYNSMISNGIMSLNEVRDKMGFEEIADEEGGNAHFIQISYGTVKDVANGAYIKQNAQEQSTQLDNKVGKTKLNEDNKK